MEALGALLWIVLIAIVCFLVGLGVGILAGYFVGRNAGRRQTSRGFPVLPPEQNP